MIRHQAPRVHGTTESRRKPLQVKEVACVILLGEEAGRPVVAALDDVHGHVGQHQSRASGHYPTTRAAPGALTAPKRNVVCP